MVPALVSSDVPSKRPTDASDAGNAKQRRHYHHKHEIKVRQEFDPEAAEIPSDGQIVDQQLERAIELVLEVLGFSHAEPLALESFRALAEQCKYDASRRRPGSPWRRHGSVSGRRSNLHDIRSKDPAHPP